LFCALKCNMADDGLVYYNYLVKSDQEFERQ
jgi:hypothetical protein